MEKSKYQTIAEHVPAIHNYEKEVAIVEQFFEEKGLSIQDTTVVFWNHLITLLERIDDQQQNVMEFEGADEMSQEAQQMTDEFSAFMHQHRSFDLTQFEKYLLTLYFEQLIKGED